MLKRSVLFLVMSFVGFGLFAQEKTKKVYRPDIPGNFLVDFGFNMPIAKPENFNQGVWGSRTLNIYYHYPIRIAESKFTFNPGGGFAFERFKLNNGFTLLPQPSTDGGYMLDNPSSVTNSSNTPISFLQNASLRKSMIVANYFDLMPVEFRFDTNPKDHSRGFNISAGVRVGLLMESHTKIKYTANGSKAVFKDKELHGLNQIRYGFYTRFGFGNFNWFMHYNLSPYFVTNKGPLNSSADPSSHTLMNTMTIGISINGF